MASDELRAFVRKLEPTMRSAAYSSYRTVLDRRADQFARELKANMSIGQRQYTQYPNWTNVHTFTKISISEKVDISNGTELNKYGYKFLNNTAGYKDVPWNTNTGGGNGHQVAFNLIANVTSSGRHKFRSTDKAKHKAVISVKNGLYNGTGFIPQVIHENLKGIDEEIYLNFLANISMTNL